MLFLKSKEDLRQILFSTQLFSKDPVYLHLPEIAPPELGSYEARINRLKTERNGAGAIRVFLTAVAILCLLYVNLLDLRIYPLLNYVVGLIFLCSAMSLVFIVRYLGIRLLLKKEVKKLLKRLNRPGEQYQWFSLP